MDTIIFGAGKISSLTRYLLSVDSEHTVAAFSANREFVSHTEHEGLPVLPFEDLSQLLDPQAHALVDPLGFSSATGEREERYAQARDMGFGTLSYVSSKAVTWPDLQTGKNCLIYDGAILQPYVVIGDNVVVRSGANVSHHCLIGDHSFIAISATLSGSVVVGRNCFIGAGATVRDNVTIADGCLIGAGAVLTRDTQPNGIYVGSPAKRTGDVRDREGN